MIDRIVDSDQFVFPQMYINCRYFHSFFQFKNRLQQQQPEFHLPGGNIFLILVVCVITEE